MQMIELERIKRMENFIQIYIDQIKILSETMKQVSIEMNRTCRIRIKTHESIFIDCEKYLLL